MASRYSPNFLTVPFDVQTLSLVMTRMTQLAFQTPPVLASPRPYLNTEGS